MTKTIALTGATGFVGRALLAHLSKDYQVKALVRRQQPEMPNVNWILGDLEDHQALTTLLKDSDIVLHCAGLIKAKSVSDFERVNAQSVKTLLQIISTKEITPHFIHISTMAAQIDGISSYGDSKRQGEEYLKALAVDIPWTIIRPPAVYGPGDMETLKLFQPLKYGLGFIPGSINNYTALICVTDLVEGISACIGQPQCYKKLLNISDEARSGYRLCDVLDHAATVLNKRPPRKIIIPRWLLHSIAIVNMSMRSIFGQTPMLTTQKVRELYHPDWTAKGDFIQDIIPWKPRFSLEDGLSVTLQWYRDKKLL